jgi:hypothetical protein
LDGSTVGNYILELRESRREQDIVIDSGTVQRRIHYIVIDSETAQYGEENPLNTSVHASLFIYGEENSIYCY